MSETSDEADDAIDRMLAALQRDEQRAVAGTMADLRPTYSREEVRRYAEALRAGSAVDDEFRLLEISISAGQAFKRC